MVNRACLRHPCNPRFRIVASNCHGEIETIAVSAVAAHMGYEPLAVLTCSRCPMTVDDQPGNPISARGGTWYAPIAREARRIGFAIATYDRPPRFARFRSARDLSRALISPQKLQTMRNDIENLVHTATNNYIFTPTIRTWYKIWVFHGVHEFSVWFPLLNRINSWSGSDVLVYFIRQEQ